MIWYVAGSQYFWQNSPMFHLHRWRKMLMIMSSIGYFTIRNHQIQNQRTEFLDEATEVSYQSQAYALKWSKLLMILRTGRILEAPSNSDCNSCDEDVWSRPESLDWKSGSFMWPRMTWGSGGEELSGEGSVASIRFCHSSSLSASC